MKNKDTAPDVYAVMHHGRVLNLFESERLAREYVRRMKLDRGVRLLVGSMPDLEITRMPVRGEAWQS